MSAWQVYLIGQADTVIHIAEACCFLLMVITIGVGVWCGMTYNIDPKDTLKVQLRWIYLTVSLIVLCVLTQVFVPSSKTLAAMYIVPKLTTGEAVSEYKELYELAKKHFVEEKR